MGDSKEKEPVMDSITDIKYLDSLLKGLDSETLTDINRICELLIMKKTPYEDTRSVYLACIKTIEYIAMLKSGL